MTFGRAEDIITAWLRYTEIGMAGWILILSFITFLQAAALLPKRKKAKDTL